MGNMSVVYEIGHLMWSHPYVSCSLLVFLTPPFFPILKFFSPLLISTALFVVALVTMGPQFEEPLDQEDDFLINASEFKALGEEGIGSRKDDDDGGERDVKFTTFKLKKDVRSRTWSDWVKSWKESGISWVEKKLQNENWKGSSLNDDNVSILEEAFAHRAEEKPTPVLTKLLTRRIPDEEERVVEEEPGDQLQRQADVIPALSHSDSWTSDRSSFDRFTTGGSNTRDLPPHNFFSPHPSFSRRHDSDVNPLFENVIPPPIDYDMPPLITGPASITAPLFKSLEDDMDSSDDEYAHHHCDHDLLEVGERTVDADLVIPHNDQIHMANGTHHQPVENLASPSDEGRSAFPEILHQENEATESSPPSTHVDSVCTGPPDMDVTETHEESAPPVPELGHNPSAEERSIPENSEESHPALEEFSSQPNVEELNDVPELEDELPEENVSSHEINPAESTPAPLPDEVHDVPATSEAPTHHTSEASIELPSHVVERSMSLPVDGSLADTGSHDDSAPTHGPLDDASLPAEEAPQPSPSLNHAISLPAVLHPIPTNFIAPPETTDQEPLSPETEVGTATTSDNGKEAPETAEPHNSIVEDETSSCAKQSMPTQDKIINMEPLSNSIPAAEGDTTIPAHPLEAATPEEMKSIVEDSSPSKNFQPDAPQLQITPPSFKVVLTPPRVKSPSGADSSPVLGRASIRPQPLSSKSSFTSRYSSSDDESGDEEIDLDSDVEFVGEDSDSEVDMPLPLPVRSGTRLKAPPKPPADQILPAHTVVQA